MRTLSLLAVIALTGAYRPQHLLAQAVEDSTRRAASSQLWTAQEIADACSHRPGARMRLYGCKPEAFVSERGEPLYVIDGEALPTDTTGPRRLAREAKVRALRVEDIEEVTSIKADSAVVRFGATARFGAILIRTKRLTPRAGSVPGRAPGV
jgi:hypothetical protein